MLDLDRRQAILTLARQGRAIRAIAKAVGVDRKSVGRVLKSGAAEVPELERETPLDPFLSVITELHLACRGNLVRVHEELAARHGVRPAYSTLTRFCRDNQIGVTPKRAVGRYEFGPGEEMQHDTSPHKVFLGERQVRLECASLVMCFSRRRFMQYFPRWNRFTARIFLTRALRYFGASAERCMVDNSTVILLRGSHHDAVISPEMLGFSKHFGFSFEAHAIGDANRSARVEAPFHHVEANFLAGRTFGDLGDLNTQLLGWCDAYNGRFHKSFGGIPDELWAIERRSARPLPDWIPDPVEVHPRKVNAEAYIALSTNRYSVPEALIGQQVEVHEEELAVRIFAGHALVATHAKRAEGEGARVTDKAHFARGRHAARTRAIYAEEVALRAASPNLGALATLLRAKRGGSGLQAIRRLHRMWLDYPSGPLESAVSRAVAYELHDLERIERMILRNVRGDFFRIPGAEDDDGR